MLLNTRKFLFYISFLCFIPSFSFADAASDLDQKLSVYKASKGDFSQGLLDANGTPEQQSSGEFALKRDASLGKFYWKTEKPSQQLLVADGKMIWIYDPSLQQVTKQSQKKEAVQNSPAILLVGDLKRLSQSYNIVEAPNAFTLTPKKTSFFKQIQILFKKTPDPKKISDIQMTVSDNLDQQTHITLKNIQALSKDDEKKFHFSPPAGVDVVEAG